MSKKWLLHGRSTYVEMFPNPNSTWTGTEMYLVDTGSSLVESTMDSMVEFTKNR